MTRLTANSTALAALVSLGLAPVASAEVVLTPEQVQTEGPARAAALPGLRNLLQAEREAGLPQDRLLCLDGSDRPCADDMALITPSGVSVQFGQGGAMILAPADMQPYATNPEGLPVPRGNALNAAAQAYLQTAQTNAAQVLGIAAPAQADTAEAAQPAPDPQPQPSAEGQQDPAAGDISQLAENSSDGPSRQEQLAQQLAAAQQQLQTDQTPQGDASDARQPAAARDSHAGDEPRIPEAAAAQFEDQRIASMALLNGVLQQEIADGLTADDLRCKDGSARPCGDGGQLVTPEGVTAEVTETGRIIIGPMAQQQYRVDEDGNLRARGSNTEAAREAAQATAPDAAALSGEGEGETVNETVTEDNARSSDEDFETTIADAIDRAAAQGEAARSSDDDDDDDTLQTLAQVALGGLGALAVGQVLNGNREVALNTGDRVIVTRADGSQQVLKDDNALLRRPGNEVQTQNFSDGSSRSVVTRPDGSQVITIRAADLSVLRRIHVAADGTETVLIDESVEVPPVELTELPDAPAPRPEAATPTTEAALREALAREAAVDRRFTLTQVRSIPEVRNLVAPVDIDAITFDTGSAAINPDQARQLATLGTVLEDAIAQNPREIFLIEGHTDAVGAAAFNLALSDRRAESVALALSEYFDVPPENLVVQGYGEEYLKVPTLTDERANRRASVRRITDLLASAQ
ncbi:Outer membrane protein OmpA [Paracoccus isoporae]|uniref:Outer membrane protein OmpA n=1 Tax=Paracoccus isoporae TaxID=591205 RepID=A0A1G7EDV6_9RHOB|nr:OmpA family protein [Paracoccus isoporae]SDE61656.1 Outer membrane protein OmpA [Paracoccus isoporae]